MKRIAPLILVMLVIATATAQHTNPRDSVRLYIEADAMAGLLHAPTSRKANHSDYQWGTSPGIALALGMEIPHRHGALTAAVGVAADGMADRIADALHSFDAYRHYLSVFLQLGYQLDIGDKWILMLTGSGAFNKNIRNSYSPTAGAAQTKPGHDSAQKELQRVAGSSAYSLLATLGAARRLTRNLQLHASLFASRTMVTDSPIAQYHVSVRHNHIGFAAGLRYTFR